MKPSGRWIGRGLLVGLVALGACAGGADEPVAEVRWDETAPAADWRRAIDIVNAWPKPDFPLAGRDLLKLGVEAGPHLGARLTALEAWWIAGDFVADREACLAKAREMLEAKS